MQQNTSHFEIYHAFVCYGLQQEHFKLQKWPLTGLGHPNPLFDGYR
jgi:hypothetical protein